jgi:hypothetical protein
VIPDPSRQQAREEEAVMGIVLGIAGAVVASLIVFAVWEIVTAGAQKKAAPILQAYAAAGPAAARLEIDRIYLPAAQVTSKNWTLVRQRLAALALVRDADSLERETAALTGEPQLVAYAGLVGCIGQAWLGRDPAVAAGRARDLHAAVEKKFPGVFGKLARDWSGALASIVFALAGGDLDAMNNAGPHLGRIVQGQPLTYILVWEAAARAFELRDEHQNARNVRERLRRFQKLCEQVRLTEVHASRAAGRT